MKITNKVKGLALALAGPLLGCAIIYAEINLWPISFALSVICGAWGGDVYCTKDKD